MGPPESATSHPENQEGGRRKRLACRPRSRRCLLKGCEQRFRPRRVRQRYCSDQCRKAARVPCASPARFRESPASRSGGPCQNQEVPRLSAPYSPTHQVGMPNHGQQTATRSLVRMPSAPSLDQQASGTQGPVSVASLLVSKRCGLRWTLTPPLAPETR